MSDVREVNADPWAREAVQADSASGFRRPSFAGVSKGAFALLGLLAALRAGGLVLVAWAIARGIAALTAGALPPETMRLMLVLGVAGVLLRAGAEWATSVLVRRIATRVKRSVRGRLWGSLADGDVAGGGTAVLASEGLDDLDEYYVQSLPATISAAITPLLVGLAVLGVDWVSALIVVLTVPLVPIFMVLIGRDTQQRTDRALTALSRFADHLAELARGLPVLVGLGRVEQQAKALERLQTSYRGRTMETLRWAFLSALALELIATISVAVVAVFLGLRLLNGTMTLEPAIFALILAPEIFGALRQVGTAFHASQDGLSAHERAEAIIERSHRRDVRAGEATGGRVHVKDLSVHYAGRTAPTLTGITAELTGIVSVAGPSGAGKSTFLAALTGTVPTDAVVRGSIRGIHADAVGWAPQAPRAFAESPRDELTLYGADPDAALAELGLAHVADAAVAELSPGELRRLAVARALARIDAAPAHDGVRLLVLDEPTAHLDRASADRVRAAIKQRANRAIIVLASHEPETTALATMTVTISGSTQPSPAGETATPPLQTDQGPVQDLAGAVRNARTTPLRLRSLLRPHWRVWAGSMVLSVLAVSMGLALTAVSGWLIVRASIEEHIMVLMVAIVGVRAFGIFRSVGRYIDRLVTHDAAFRSVDDLRLRLWRAIAARGAGSRRLLEGGAPLDYLVTLANDLRDQLPRVLPPLGVGIAVIAGTGLTTAFVAPQLTVVVVLTLLVSVAAAAVLAIVSERGGAAARIEARSDIVRGTAALSAAALDLRGNGVSGAALKALDLAGDRLAMAERKAAWSAGLGGALVTVAVAMLAIAVPVLGPDLSGEAAAVIALLVLALLDPLADFVDAARRLPALRGVLVQLGSVLRPVPRPTWGDLAPPKPVVSVELDDVAVQYPDTQRPVVSGISGSAHSDRWLVLDGPSGSGKSTLLSAIMGALPLAKGSIVVSGANAHDPNATPETRALTQLDEQAWKSTVAWCPQDAYVFDSTLRGNLLLARTDAPAESELREILVTAGLGPLLDTLPDGLDTRVGPGGAALSGGERQRLAVARAVLTQAEVILLDEPTAHLDAATADVMMSDVRATTVGRVVVLISHRTADREPTDTIVRLR